MSKLKDTGCIRTEAVYMAMNILGWNINIVGNIVRNMWEINSFEDAAWWLHGIIWCEKHDRNEVDVINLDFLPGSMFSSSYNCHLICPTFVVSSLVSEMFPDVHTCRPDPDCVM